MTDLGKHDRNFTPKKVSDKIRNPIMDSTNMPEIMQVELKEELDHLDEVHTAQMGSEGALRETWSG